MTTAPPIRASARSHADSIALDWAATATLAWFVGGLYLDGWAHVHKPDLETFFTPWHAALYSGFFATALLLAGAWVMGRREGRGWREALPPGYGLSLAGVGLFAAGGAGDMVWHTLFGVEASVEALFSPTHLVLATGLVLIASGPLRAAWSRPGGLAGFARAGPALVSAAFTLSVLTFFTQIFHPVSRAWAASPNRPTSEVFPLVDAWPRLAATEGGLLAVDMAMMAGAASFILQAFFLVGLALLLLRRWELPFGAFTAILTLNATLMGLMRDQPSAIAAAALAGLCADALARASRPAPARPLAFRAFATLLPMLVAGLHFAMLLVVSEVWWSIHLWAGMIVVTGLAGALVSLLAVPPAAPFRNGDTRDAP